MLKRLVATTAFTPGQARAADDGVSLARVLTAKHLVLLGLGAVIGAGIFVITGTAAAEFAGPALVLSFALAGLACALAGLCYAEFSSMLPVSGGAYSYTYASLGEALAWLVGCCLTIEYLFAASVVAVGWSGYFNEMLTMLGHWVNLDLSLPAALAHAPLAFNDQGLLLLTGAIVNLPALLVVALLGWVCYRGISSSMSLNNAIVCVKVAAIVLFVAWMLRYVQPHFWQPFVPPNEGGDHYGWSGVIRGAAIVFLAYLGFDAIATSAAEAKNPQRDMPIGILVSLLLCTLLYMAVAAILTGIAPYGILDTAEPVATALNYVLGTVAGTGYASTVLVALKGLVVFAALAGLSSVVLVMLFSQARIFYSMAQDGLLPKFMGRTHARYRTPHISTLLVTVVAALTAGLFRISLLGDLVVMGALLAFMVVCIGVLVLRHTRPELERPFRVPFAWLVCPAGALICGGLFWQTFQGRWQLMLGMLLIGGLVYAVYGYRHSHLRQEESPS